MPAFPKDDIKILSPSSHHGLNKFYNMTSKSNQASCKSVPILVKTLTSSLSDLFIHSNVLNVLLLLVKIKKIFFVENTYDLNIYVRLYICLISSELGDSIEELVGKLIIVKTYDR